MARRSLVVEFTEPVPRPMGSVQFADPSTHCMQRINPGFVGPASGNTGPRHQETPEGITGRLVPWDDRTQYTTQDTWAGMNRKRGTFEAEDD